MNTNKLYRIIPKEVIVKPTEVELKLTNEQALFLRDLLGGTSLFEKRATIRTYGTFAHLSDEEINEMSETVYTLFNDISIDLRGLHMKNQ